MADYPSIPQHKGTVLNPLEAPSVLQTATNGVPIQLVLGDVDQQWFNIDVAHLGRPLADVTTLKDHYKAHFGTAQSFNFLYAGDGLTYSCFWVRHPRYVWESGNHWSITCSLMGTV